VKLAAELHLHTTGSQLAFVDEITPPKPMEANRTEGGSRLMSHGIS
jgi:hypothetical protein